MKKLLPIGLLAFITQAAPALADTASVSISQSDVGTYHQDTYIRDETGNVNDTLSSGNSGTTLFAGFASDNTLYYGLFQDTIFIDSVLAITGGVTPQFDSAIWTVSIQQISQTTVGSKWYDIYQISDTWVEQASVGTNPGAASFIYRDSTTSFQTWTTSYNSQAVLYADSMIEAKECGFCKDTIVTYKPGVVKTRANAFDSANGSEGESTSGDGFHYSVNVWFDSAFCRKQFDGTYQGWAIHAGEDTSSSSFNEYVRFNATENTTSTRRWYITWFFSWTPATPSGPPNEIHGGRIHSPSGSSRIH